MDSGHEGMSATRHLTMSDAEWDKARMQARVIAELAERDEVGAAAADDAAEELGVSRRQIYLLLGRYRQGTGLVTDLLSGQSGGGRGTSRLPDEVEEIIRDTIRTRFLSQQKRTMGSVHREIVRICARRGLPAPSRNTVITRIKHMNPVEVGRRRGGPNSVRPLQSAGGQPPVIEGAVANF